MRSTGGDATKHQGQALIFVESLETIKANGGDNIDPTNHC
jgi:hypothetical protein